MISRPLALALALASCLNACTSNPPRTVATRAWVHADDRRPRPQEIAQASDGQYDALTRTVIRTARQWHNDIPPEGHTF